MSLTEPSSLCTFWSTWSTFKASSAYKAIKILLVVSELLTKPHSLLLSVHSLLATKHRHGSTVDVWPQFRPRDSSQLPHLRHSTQEDFSPLPGPKKTPKKAQPPARNYFQCQILGLENQMLWFFLFLFLICLLFSAFASHLSRKIPTSDISKHFSGATVYKLPQHSTDTNFLCSLNAEFITRH